MKYLCTASLVAATCLLASTFALAETFNVSTGSSWNVATNWSPNNIPNAIGASVVINGAATADNPDQTANRTIPLDGTKTVGSIVLNNDLSTYSNTISNGTGGPLIFDQFDAGPATINVPNAAGTGNNTLSATMRFDDTVVATVDDVSVTSAAGAITFTGAISGAGGFTKLGDGLATFGTGAKTYTGPTVLGGGRMRISSAARPSATSSFTINAGGQLDMITAGVYSFGSGPLNLNGAGPTTGPYAAFGGAIRPDRLAGASAYEITNPVVLQSDSLIHVQANAGIDNVLTLSGNISGPGQLQFTDPATGDPNVGRLVLTGAQNTYSGGTLIRAGTLEARGAMTSLGTGDVTVLSGSLLPFGGSAAISKLIIQAGDNNAIADTATLSLAGGKTPDFADDGFVELLTNETVGGLILGGVMQSLGTYGSTLSGAEHQLDEYFAGTGILTVAMPTIQTGDFDGDGDVDGADFVAWQTNYPLASGATLAQGDGNGDGAVNGADFAIWQGSFPLSPSPGATPVPEPSSLILLCLCGLSAIAMRRITIR